MIFSRLFKRFDLLGDDSGTIQQLRKLIVVLAVGGKLEPFRQEEDAPALLEKINEYRRSLTKNRKRQPKFSRIEDEELPSGFVETARFVRLGLVAHVVKGRTGIRQAQPGPYPLVVTAAERQTCDHFDFDCAAAIIPLVSSTGHGHASINRLHFQEGKFALGSILAAVVPYAPELISARFLYEYLSAFKDELLVSRMTGTANVTLAIGRISEVPVPLVPSHLQKRVDELMALCDELEAARNEREARRDRLVAASLHRLQTAPAIESEEQDANQSAATLRAAARFHLDYLSRLVTRPEHIRHLREAVLGLAVRGNLVPQLPDEDPAPDFDPTLPDDLVAPFEIPAGWRWARLYKLGQVKGGGTPSKGRDEFWEGDIPWVSPKDMKVDYLYNAQLHITDAAVAHTSARLIDPESILFVVRGMILVHSFPVAVARVPLAINQDMKALTLHVSEMAEYILRALKGLKLEMLSKVERSAHGTCRLERRSYEGFLIPIPPLAEQCRIVAKVDELMTLCDQLEAQLTATETDSNRLLKAVLRDALAPVEEESAALATETA